jgi:hypothetical protein
MGRLMLIHRRQGMASNYDCNQCACPYTYNPPIDYVYPEGANILVGNTQPLTFYGGFQDCNHNPYYYNENGSASWTPGDPSIATVDSSGNVTGHSGGTTTITGQFSDYAYVWNQMMWYCSSSLLQGQASASACGQVPTFVLIGSNPCPGHTCPSGYNNVPERQILYQVLDVNGYAIQAANMLAAETLFNIAGTCSGSPTASSAYTSAYGTFYDHVWLCCQSGSNCGKSWNQSFTVNNYTVLVTTGLIGGLTGGKNAISTSCTNGVGSCPVVTPTP